MADNMSEKQKKMSRLKSRLPDGVHTPFVLVLITTIIACVSSVLGYFFLPPEIPLFYSLALSSQHLASKEFIFILPSLAIFIAVINSTIIMRLQKYDVLLIRLFAWITVVCLLLILFALIRILTIVL